MKVNKREGSRGENPGGLERIIEILEKEGKISVEDAREQCKKGYGFSFSTRAILVELLDAGYWVKLEKGYIAKEEPKRAYEV